MTGKAEDIHIVQAETMRRFCVAACKEVRLSPEHAEILADALIQADLRGIQTHGINMLPRYIKGYQVGGVNPRPSIKVMKDAGAIAVMDGDDGLGQVVSHPAMKLAMRKATEHGVGIAVIRRSNHYGMAAHWSMMALERDMIGYTTTNAPPTLAPWGGVTRSYGNNPISYAIPAGKELPIVLDIAMSVVARGKIILAALKDEPLPQGWAMDKDGEPTTDANTAMQGLLMPISGHKGYGMALVNEVLSGVLSGGLFGTDIPEWNISNPTKSGHSHFFMALDIAHFMPVTEFKERVDKIVRMIKGSQLVKGKGKIYLPGELEFETYRQRIKEGIPYSKAVISQLEKLAQDLHISPTF